MKERPFKCWSDHRRSGQGLTEYLILLVLISLVSIAAVRSLGGTIQKKLSLIRNHIEKVSPTDRERQDNWTSPEAESIDLTF
jgi:Flp pilus assembly pilin Flp